MSNKVISKDDIQAFNMSLIVGRTIKIEQIVGEGTSIILGRDTENGHLYVLQEDTWPVKRQSFSG